MKAYKIVRRRRGSLFSAIVVDTPLQIEYIPGKITVPKMGYLMAFDSPETLTKFRIRNLIGEPMWEFWECEAEIVDGPIWTPSSVKEDDIVRFWILLQTSNMTNYPDDMKRSVVEGTVFCSSITLTKRLKIPRL